MAAGTTVPEPTATSSPGGPRLRSSLDAPKSEVEVPFPGTPGRPGAMGREKTNSARVVALARKFEALLPGFVASSAKELEKDGSAALYLSLRHQQEPVRIDVTVLNAPNPMMNPDHRDGHDSGSAFVTTTSDGRPIEIRVEPTTPGDGRSVPSLQSLLSLRGEPRGSARELASDVELGRFVRRVVDEAG